MGEATLKPLNDKLVILPDDNQKQTTQGLYVPDQAQGHNNSGVVVAVGPGKLLQDGNRAEMQVKVNDRVWFNAAAGFKVTKNDVDYSVVGEEQVFVIDNAS
ncbi:MAG: co-chaperone GroES [Armatimonadetes bacterium]|nr:co-chaperone GroES [Armatimonadota bacterium]